MVRGRVSPGFCLGLPHWKTNEEKYEKVKNLSGKNPMFTLVANFSGTTGINYQLRVSLTSLIPEKSYHSETLMWYVSTSVEITVWPFAT